VLVGDPSAAKATLDAVPAGRFRESLARPGTASERSTAARPICPPEGPDFTTKTQQQFDAVADQCAEAGYRVVRIPMVPGLDGRTYLSYLNVIVDERDGRQIVYLPTFGGVESLNRAARQVWRELGFEVRVVDCTACYPHFGTLRCLVNVLRRA
jgi:hypothetical protein